MCCVTKATPIHFINGKCHIKQLKSRKSCKTCLTITHILLYHIISQHRLLMSQSGHTDMHKYWHANWSNFKKPGVHQLQASMPDLKMGLVWFTGQSCSDTSMLIKGSMHKYTLVHSQCYVTTNLSWSCALS